MKCAVNHRFAPGAAPPIDDGPDFDGLSERLAATTEAFIADKGSKLKVTVVGHDWVSELLPHLQCL